MPTDHMLVGTGNCQRGWSCQGRERGEILGPKEQKDIRFRPFATSRCIQYIFVLRRVLIRSI